MFMLMRHFFTPRSAIGFRTRNCSSHTGRKRHTRQHRPERKISKTKDKSVIAGSLKPAKGIAIIHDKLKRIDNRLDSAIMKPAARKVQNRVAPEGAPLYESFEGWDGTDAEWLPEGWTRKQTNEDPLKT